MKAFQIDRWPHAISVLTGKHRRRNNLILAVILLLFTFPARVILSETNVELKDGKVALLRELSGTNLLISASPNPPWFNEQVEANGTVTYYGLHVNICNYLAEALNATYSFVRARNDEETTIGRREATNNLLQRGEVNISAKFVLLVMVECIHRADCSIPLYKVRNQLMVPFPEEESHILAPIRPFQLEVWILVTISIICVTLTITYLPIFYKDRFGRRDMGTSAIYVLTGSGTWDQWKHKLSFRILQGTWCLAAFVLLNAYSSTIVSYLTAPKLMPVANTLDQVASGYPQNLKLLIEKDNIMTNRYLDATAGTWKLLGDSLRRNPDGLFLSQEEAVKKMLTNQYAYYHADMRVMVLMDKLYNESEKRCHFTVINQGDFVPAGYLVFSFTKHWRYTQAVNHRLKALAESGLVPYWVKKTLPKLDQCQLDNYEKAAEEKRVLSLKDFAGPFLFLLAGMAVSFLVFLIEKIVFIYRQSTTVTIKHNYLSSEIKPSESI